ncbi:hypothetical protein B5S33_g1598 [[Candida] boidinii]|nr:hypothetical protein B5S33_g1598 [[Candida] boidinii]
MSYINYHNVLKINGQSGKESCHGSPAGIEDTLHTPQVSVDNEEDEHESEFLSTSSQLHTKDVIGCSTLEALPGAVTPPPPILHSIEEDTVLSNLNGVGQHSLESATTKDTEATCLAFLDQFQNDMMTELDSFYEDITQAFKETSTPERQTEVSQVANGNVDDSISSEERLLGFISEQMKHLSGNSPVRGSGGHKYGNKKRVKFALSDNVREISFHDYQGQNRGYSQSATKSATKSPPPFTNGDSTLERNKKFIVQRRRRLKNLILKFHREKRKKGESTETNNDLIKCCSRRKAKSKNTSLVTL